MDEEVVSINTDTLIKRLDNWADKLTGILTKLNQQGGPGATAAVGTVPSAGQAAGNYNPAQIGAYGDAFTKLTKTLNLTDDQRKKLGSGFNEIISSRATKQITDFGSTTSSTFKGMMGTAKALAEGMKQHSGEIISALGSGGVIAATKAFQYAIQKVGDATGYNAAQKNLFEVNRAALQTGIAFDGMADQAEQSLNGFNRSIRESSNQTKAARETVLEVNKSLSTTFGSESLARLGNLQQGTARLGEAFNATNVAILASTATGINHAQITSLMNTAHTQLGESVEGSVLALGRISESAKKSGIGFEATMNSIQESTGALKLWGGTIGAVSPLFDMFNRSLRGTGREGLTPQLLQSLTSGLSGMTTSTKALLGLQSGMGGAGGALGAALEIEEAMEKGPAGMKKVVDSLTQTLTQSTGGKIITRAEARSDPALLNQFMMQRQLLGQLMHMDEGTANKTLDALSGIQQTGLDTGSDAAKSIADLVGAGQKVADTTTTATDQAAIKVESAINKQGGEIIQAIQKLGVGMNLEEYMMGIDDVLNKITEAGLDPEDVARLINKPSTREEKIREREIVNKSLKDMPREQRAEIRGDNDKMRTLEHGAKMIRVSEDILLAIKAPRPIDKNLLDELKKKSGVGRTEADLKLLTLGREQISAKIPNMNLTRGLVNMGLPNMPTSNLVNASVAAVGAAKRENIEEQTGLVAEAKPQKLDVNVQLNLNTDLFNAKVTKISQEEQERPYRIGKGQ